MIWSGDRRQGWETQVYDESQEDHLVIMDIVRHALMKLSYSGVWITKMWVFTKQ
jgi:hypothetical protein